MTGECDQTWYVYPVEYAYPTKYVYPVEYVHPIEYAYPIELCIQLEMCDEMNPHKDVMCALGLPMCCYCDAFRCMIVIDACLR